MVDNLLPGFTAASGITSSLSLPYDGLQLREPRIERPMPEQRLHCESDANPNVEYVEYDEYGDSKYDGADGDNNNKPNAHLRADARAQQVVLKRKPRLLKITSFASPYGQQDPSPLVMQPTGTSANRNNSNNSTRKGLFRVKRNKARSSPGRISLNQTDDNSDAKHDPKHSAQETLVVNCTKRTALDVFVQNGIFQHPAKQRFAAGMKTTSHGLLDSNLSIAPKTIPPGTWKFARAFRCLGRLSDVPWAACTGVSVSFDDASSTLQALAFLPRMGGTTAPPRSTSTSQHQSQTPAGSKQTQRPLSFELIVRASAHAGPLCVCIIDQHGVAQAEHEVQAGAQRAAQVSVDQIILVHDSESDSSNGGGRLVVRVGAAAARLAERRTVIWRTGTWGTNTTSSPSLSITHTRAPPPPKGEKRKESRLTLSLNVVAPIPQQRYR